MFADSLHCMYIGHCCVKSIDISHIWTSRRWLHAHIYRWSVNITLVDENVSYYFYNTSKNHNQN